MQGTDLEPYRADSLANWHRFVGIWEQERDFLWSATGSLGERLAEDGAALDGVAVSVLCH